MKLEDFRVLYDGEDTDGYVEEYKEFLKEFDGYTDEDLEDYDVHEDENFYDYVSDIIRMEAQAALESIQYYLSNLDNDEGWVIVDNHMFSRYGLPSGQVVSGYLGICDKFKDFRVKGAFEADNFEFTVANNKLTIGYSHHDGYSSYTFVNLGYLTKAELLELAADNGLHYKKSILKYELIENLSEDLYQY